jgi:hypothetical protein
LKVAGKQNLEGFFRPHTHIIPVFNGIRIEAGAVSLNKKRIPVILPALFTMSLFNNPQSKDPEI